MMMDGHQGLWRIADALDDGVDMLTDTKKILRFDEYEQLFPTDKQLDRLYDGCDETAYFETIENCLFAKSRGAIKTDIGYYFVQPKGKVEYKLKTTPGSWPKEWLVENFQSIFEEEQCPCIKGNGSMHLDYDANISVLSGALEENIAMVTFVVGWDDGSIVTGVLGVEYPWKYIVTADGTATLIEYDELCDVEDKLYKLFGLDSLIVDASTGQTATEFINSTIEKY